MGLCRLRPWSFLPRVAPPASYNDPEHGFENASMGESFAGVTLEMQEPIVDSGATNAERVQVISEAWKRLGEEEGDVFATAGGEGIGWKAGS